MDANLDAIGVVRRWSETQAQPCQLASDRPSTAVGFLLGVDD
jgi:hypothetical protein